MDESDRTGKAGQPSAKWRRGKGNRKRLNQNDVIAALKRAERREMVLRLKAQGMSFAGIAIAVREATGQSYSETQAKRDFHAIVQERTETAVDDHRAMLDGALRAVFQGHLDKARGGSAQSGMVVARVARELASLYGLRIDRFEISGPGGASLGPIVMVPEKHEAHGGHASSNGEPGGEEASSESSEPEQDHGSNGASGPAVPGP